eukprot:scaffold16871_cov118-Isochrysis_galbana.AAC.4
MGIGRLKMWPSKCDEIGTIWCVWASSGAGWLAAGRDGFTSFRCYLCATSGGSGSIPEVVDEPR